MEPRDLEPWRYVGITGLDRSKLAASNMHSNRHKNIEGNVQDLNGVEL